MHLIGIILHIVQWTQTKIPFVGSAENIVLRLNRENQHDLSRLNQKKKRETEAKRFTSYGLIGRLLFAHNRVTGISYLVDGCSQFSIISATAADKIRTHRNFPWVLNKSLIEIYSHKRLQRNLFDSCFYSCLMWAKLY